MPETTTAVNACDATVLLDDNTGHLVDISGSTNRVEFQVTVENADYKVFGGAWLKRLTCKKDATINFQAVYTTAPREAKALLLEWLNNSPQTPRTLRVLFPDDSIGADDFQAEVFISSMNIPIDGTQAGPVMIAATLLQSGGVTIGTQAT